MNPIEGTGHRASGAIGDFDQQSGIVGFLEMLVADIAITQMQSALHGVRNIIGNAPQPVDDTAQPVVEMNWNIGEFEQRELDRDVPLKGQFRGRNRGHDTVDFGIMVRS